MANSIAKVLGEIFTWPETSTSCQYTRRQVKRRKKKNRKEEEPNRRRIEVTGGGEWDKWRREVDIHTVEECSQ